MLRMQRLEAPLQNHSLKGYVQMIQWPILWPLKVSLRLDRARAVASARTQRGRPPSPVERRPNSLVCASFNPSLQLGKERVEASGSRRPGAMDSSVGSFSPRAPETVQVERRLAWRTIACPPKDQPRSLLRLLEQGPESQSASSVCWGGVSSVMGSSDLDAHSFVPSGHKVIGIEIGGEEPMTDDTPPQHTEEAD